MEASPSSHRGARRTVVAALVATGFGLLALGFILGLMVDRPWFAIWFLAIAAFAAAWYASARSAPPEAPGGEPRPGESTERVDGADAVHDPSLNPYGRRDV